MFNMSHPEVHGLVVLARNGDRSEFYQDPVTYNYGPALSTALGEVRTTLRSLYLVDTNFVFLYRPRLTNSEASFAIRT